MTSQIGIYQYTYGSGNTPNRQIEFYGDGQKIWGVISKKTQNSWSEIDKITESQMTKEGASTTEKMKLMMEARKSSTSPKYPADKSFYNIPYIERVKVIKNLEPTGSYRITITNNIGSNPTFEIVDNLIFFDPS